MYSQFAFCSCPFLRVKAIGVVPACACVTHEHRQIDIDRGAFSAACEHQNNLMATAKCQRSAHSGCEANHRSTTTTTTTICICGGSCKCSASPAQRPLNSNYSKLNFQCDSFYTNLARINIVSAVRPAVRPDCTVRPI